MTSINFELTKQYIYRKCVNRVETKRKSEKIIKPQIALCESDKSLVSNFFNCKITLNNPYLVTKRLIKYESEKLNTRSGACYAFNFSDAHEVLWGDDAEFKENLFPIFTLIIKDILDSEHKYRNTILDVLSDNIIFAKYATLCKIKHKYKISLLKYFGVCDEMVEESSMNQYLEIALQHLFSKKNFKSEYYKIFYAFTKKHDDYTHIDTRLVNEFLPDLIKLLKQYIPLPNSLGLRVKTLIETDLIKSIEQINSSETEFTLTPEYNFNQKIIRASSHYITQLEEIAYFLYEINGSSAVGGFYDDIL